MKLLPKEREREREWHTRTKTDSYMHRHEDRQTVRGSETYQDSENSAIGTKKGHPDLRKEECFFFFSKYLLLFAHDRSRKGILVNSKRKDYENSGVPLFSNFAHEYPYTTHTHSLPKPTLLTFSQISMKKRNRKSL